MKQCIAELLDRQGEIIRLQADIIDRLSAAVLQHGALDDVELEMISRAAKLQEGIQE